MKALKSASGKLYTLNGKILIDDSAEPIMPVKGQLITIDVGSSITPSYGTNNQFRVLSTDENIAYVMAMFNPTNSVKYNAGGTTTYAGAALDTYLNTTWYNSLSATAKSAIVANQVNHYTYSYNASVYNETTHASYADYSTKDVKADLGDRYVYPIDIEDIETYFNGVFSKDNLIIFFGNTGSNSWLRSSQSSSYAYYMHNSGMYIARTTTDYVEGARPAFLIDLSKISWS